MPPSQARLRKSAKTTSDNADAASAKSSKQTLRTWADLEPEARDNHYITTGYRHPSTSFMSSVNSLLYLHNESVNILTHLLGSLYFLTAAFLFVVSFANITPNPSLVLDAASVAVFYAAAVTCMGLSATYHLSTDREYESVKKWQRLDYAGIVVLTWGSFVPCLRFGFRSRSDLGLSYLCMITAVGAACLFVVLKPRFATPEYRPARAAMFAAMGLSAVLPTLHGIAVYGFARLRSTISLDHVLLSGALYIVGAALYAARIPERYNAGRHDIWGSSHQIFHVLVVVAAYVHMLGLHKSWEHEHGVWT